MSPYLILATVLLLATATVLVVTLRRRLRIVTVEGDSMLPALAPGDQVLVRVVPLPRVVAGDIVVLAPPFRKESWDETWLIKRAVATPGDPVPASVAPALGVRPGTPVAAGALVVIGDNREVSRDSRAFGYVTADDLLGVMLRPIRRRPREAAPQPAR